MEKISVLLALFTIVLAIAGCGQRGETISNSQQVKNGNQPADLNTVWDGTPPSYEAIPDFFADAPEINAFPESVAGLWEAELLAPIAKWDIDFEPDGSIKWIYHALAGRINIEEGGTESNTEDSYYVFVMGPCEARYIPSTRTLKVKIIVDYFIMNIPAGKIEGRQEDYFEGPISEDGYTWGTQWRSFRWIKGGPPPDINYMRAAPDPLVFIKIDPNNPPEEPPLR
ncbi:MAG: hypothetical protein ABII09_12010 [Planctomycetota bacterium]